MGARVGPRSEDHAARNVVRGAVRDASRALSADGPARRASWGDSLGDDRVGSSDHARLFSDGIGPDGVGGSMGRGGPAYHERVWYARYVLVLLLLTYLFNQAVSTRLVHVWLATCGRGSRWCCACVSHRRVVVDCVTEHGVRLMCEPGGDVACAGPLRVCDRC